MKETRLNRHQSYSQDNRDSEQMYDYLESRIQVLKQRVFELEMENATLRCQVEDTHVERVSMYA